MSETQSKRGTNTKQYNSAFNGVLIVLDFDEQLLLLIKQVGPFCAAQSVSRTILMMRCQVELFCTRSIADLSAVRVFNSVLPSV
ncbi:MAG: hypothetical protein ACPGVO_15085 [Spirulinaceae cyanobacterium]